MATSTRDVLQKRVENKKQVGWAAHAGHVQSSTLASRASWRFSLIAIIAASRQEACTRRRGGGGVHVSQFIRSRLMSTFYFSTL